MNMEPKKDDVKWIVDDLNLVNLHQQLETALSFASKRSLADNLRPLNSLQQQPNEACHRANAAKEEAKWDHITRAYFNKVIRPMWQLLDDCKKFYREFGNKDFYTAVQPPRALTPTPTTRSQRPSFTVANHPVKSQDDNLHKGDSSGVSESGEGKGVNVDGGDNIGGGGALEGGGVGALDGGGGGGGRGGVDDRAAHEASTKEPPPPPHPPDLHPQGNHQGDALSKVNQDDILPSDSISNTSTTSSARNRRQMELQAEERRMEELEEKHRLERKKAELEKEMEEKELQRKMEELRR